MFLFFPPFFSSVPADKKVAKLGQIMIYLHSTDHLVPPHLPLREVVQELSAKYRSNPQEICARSSCRIYGSHAAT